MVARRSAWVDSSGHMSARVAVRPAAAHPGPQPPGPRGKILS